MKSIYIALVSGTIGLAAGAAVPQLTAQAATNLTHEQVFSGTANATLLSQVQSGTGVAAQALAHANNALGIGGTAKALSFAPASQCPLRAINLNYEVVGGVCQLKWEYATRAIPGTWTAADPQ